MDKIWIIKSNKYQKKYTIYKEESKLLKALSIHKDCDILEYKLQSETKSSDYLLSKDRDTQLKSLLGELTEKEKACVEFINLFEKKAPVGKEFKKHISWSESIPTSTKNEMLLKLRKFQSEPKEIARLLTKEKSYFITILQTTEWYLSILKVHNFRDHKINKRTWNRELKIYETKDDSSEELRNNFKLAKKMLNDKTKKVKI